ncbi:MAG TPA: FAD-dependent oxidoreductase, partial [Variovorax sp.]|nr:FAD-dependent oxidoreductase [Variovorax sp.]
AGFQIGPAAGEVLAELARDGHTDTPIAAFAIERFGEQPACAPATDSAVSPVSTASPT